MIRSLQFSIRDDISLMQGKNIVFQMTEVGRYKGQAWLFLEVDLIRTFVISHYD